MRGRNATLIKRYFPGYRSPKLAYERVLDEQVWPDTVWLDIGCGHSLCSNKDLNAELPRRAQLAVGIDPDPYLSRHSSIRHLVRCDAAALPFRSGLFSLVTASMVVEHLEKPEIVLREIARVSRPCARFVLFTPNRFNYAMVIAASTPYRFHVLYKRLSYYFATDQWRNFEEDLFPTWYRANSVGRLRRLLRQAGFAEACVKRLSFAHSFGFIRPLYVLSLLFERIIDRKWLEVLKADILGVYVRLEEGMKSRS
jgi:SAM-dependent methyltransferase